MTPFHLRVLSVTRQIPVGRVTTYGDIASMAGRPGAARAVGNIMRECRDPGVPCHRVVGAGGALGGFGRSPHLKRALLRAEGLVVRETRLPGFATARWQGPSGPRSARFRPATR